MIIDVFMIIVLPRFRSKHQKTVVKTRFHRARTPRRRQAIRLQKMPLNMVQVRFGIKSDEF